MGGTMRLGAYRDTLVPGSRVASSYGATEIIERHRHRYEINPEYRKQLERAGMRVTGTAMDGGYVDVVEIDDHPWFLACQYHPEFSSSPLRPHALFIDFIRNAILLQTR